MVILDTDNYLLSGYHDNECYKCTKCTSGYYRYFCWHANPKPLVSISNGELTDLWKFYSEDDSRKIRRVGHVARVEEKRIATAFGWEI
jgi:hypothetical protein